MQGSNYSGRRDLFNWLIHGLINGEMYVSAWNPHNVPTFEAIGVSNMTLWAFLGLESACANTDVVKILKEMFLSQFLARH